MKEVNIETINPQGDKILVEREAGKKESDGGILLPEIAQRAVNVVGESTGFCTARVIAVGHGRKTKSGKVVPFQVGVGDRVYFNRFGGVEIDVPGRDCLLISEEEILMKETVGESYEG